MYLLSCCELEIYIANSILTLHWPTIAPRPFCTESEQLHIWQGKLGMNFYEVLHLQLLAIIMN